MAAWPEEARREDGLLRVRTQIFDTFLRAGDEAADGGKALRKLPQIRSILSVALKCDAVPRPPDP